MAALAQALARDRSGDADMNLHNINVAAIQLWWSRRHVGCNSGNCRQTTEPSSHNVCFEYAGLANNFCECDKCYIKRENDFLRHYITAKEFQTEPYAMCNNCNEGNHPIPPPKFS